MGTLETSLETSKDLSTLWEDADCLYDMNADGYRITGTKDVVLRKFATVLHIPHEYIFKKKISIHELVEVIELK